MKFKFRKKSKGKLFSKGGEDSLGRSRTVSKSSSCSSEDTDVTVTITENMKSQRVYKFSVQQIKEVKDAFAMFDKQAAGCIQRKHLISVLRSLGHNPTEDEIDDVLRMIDSEATFISFIEFLEMFAKLLLDIDDIIKEAFYIFDEDGSGSIDVEEFRHVMKTMGSQMTDQEIDDIMKEFDFDGDGEIDLEEFVALIRDGLGEDYII